MRRHPLHGQALRLLSFFVTDEIARVIMKTATFRGIPKSLSHNSHS